MNAAKKFMLSKSQYLKGRQCPKALWLYRHRKDIEIPADEGREQLFSIGHNIGEVAKQYFRERGPACEVVGQYWEIEQGARQTRSFLAEGEEVIFEATAQSERGYCRIDVLRKHKDGQVDLIEVKAASKVKAYHLEDMAFQYHIFQNAGFPIQACYMMLINTSYTRQGELELDKLFYFSDISSQVLARQQEVLEQSVQLSEMLKCKEEPEVAIGPHCENPFSCEYFAYCETLSCQREGELFATPQKAPQIREAKETQTEVSSKPKMLQGWLAQLRYPLYFLDYESMQSCIPLFDNSRPYQNIPFQFSLHKLESESGEPEHFSFLHTQQSDPRPVLIQALLEYCGEQGSILVYSQNFESSINVGLAQSFPKHSQALLQLNQRMCDMLIPFQKHWLHSPLQNGSNSLKAVLPAFSDLSYEGLDIGNGLTAMNNYLSFMLGAYSAEEAHKLHQDLLLYCQQDTMALVVLLQVMRKLSLEP